MGQGHGLGIGTKKIQEDIVKEYCASKDEDEDDDEEFQDAFSDNVTTIKNEIVHIAYNLESLICQATGLQEKMKIIGDF